MIPNQKPREKKLSVVKWSRIAVAYCVQKIAPTPSYKEIRPSLGFLQRQDLTKGCLRLNNNSKPSQERFYLSHLMYFCKKHMKDEFDKILTCEALRVNILLGRVHVYFRKLKTLFPSPLEMLRALGRPKGHTTGPRDPSLGYPPSSPNSEESFGNTSFGSLSEQPELVELARLLKARR